MFGSLFFFLVLKNTVNIENTKFKEQEQFSVFSKTVFKNSFKNMNQTCPLHLIVVST